MAAPARRLDRSDADAVCAVGRAAGLVAVGIARAEPFTGTRRDLEERRAAGLHGGMAFTYRRPERSSDPTGALPDARSLVVGAWAYPVAVEPPPADDGSIPPPMGRVARYATDAHYERLRGALDRIAAHLRADGWRTRVLVDDNALVDREAARRAGLGWYGRSANLLVPGHGPWVVLGSVLTDAPLTPTGEDVPDGCGTCRRCVDACPTGAIVADGVVDARRCLSWRLQDTGTFPPDLREALGDRIYGCDDCLEVCPPGRRAGDGSLRDGAGERADQGQAGHRPTGAEGSWVDLVDLLGASDEALLDRHGRWYVPRRDPRYLRRNAIVVLGNTADPLAEGVREAVERHLADERPVVRAHAVWAARRLGFDDLWPALADDPDPDVRAEVAAVVVRRPDLRAAAPSATAGTPGSVAVAPARVDTGEAHPTTGPTSGRT